MAAKAGEVHAEGAPAGGGTPDASKVTSTAVAPALPTPVSQELSTTKSELLSDAITKQGATDRAWHISAHMENRAAEQAERVRQLEKSLQDALLANARYEEQLDAARRATVPALAIQAVGATLGAFGGYVITLAHLFWVGLAMMILAVVLLFFASWRLVAGVPPSKRAG